MVADQIPRQIPSEASAPQADPNIPVAQGAGSQAGAPQGGAGETQSGEAQAGETHGGGSPAPAAEAAPHGDTADTARAATLEASLGAALLGSAADAILLADPDGMIRFWNPGATRIFGFSRDEALGQPLDLIIPETLRARHNEGYARTIATGQSRYGSGDLLAVPALTRDGRRISVEFTIVLLHGADGAVSGVAAVMRDVTARFHEMRELRQRLAKLTPPQ